uniref:Nucleoside phosphorylase domain-containing protein n=1 Tax=Setaria digitata TaxID=48799 RepID=A0A915PWD2_9BILA
MVATKVPHSGGLVVLSSLVQGEEHNVVLVSRNIDVECGRILHVAGGEHTGIIINKFSDGKPNLKCDVALSFSVWLRNGDMKKQENRSFRFRFFNDLESVDKHSTAQQFFRDLVNAFPRDYVTFLKRILKLMQSGYGTLREIEIDMQFAKENEAYQMPDPKEYDSGSEVENVTIAHVQEVLEHAYPNGLSVDIIAESLRCTNTEIEGFLHELEALGIVQKLQNEWIRFGPADSIDTSRILTGFGSREHPPTVAIITCLFVEKQSIDAIIDSSTTVHRYRSGGDSNIYTLGWIGKHRVVATKLAIIGDSREATTSAGSITTRLLGNFQHVEHVFIVGVGGGVAHYTDATRHVRLGDVVVSAPDPNSYVFSHAYTVDRVTEHVNGFLVRNWNPQDAIITHIARNMDEKMVAEWNSITKATIDNLDAANNDTSFSKPPPQADLLALPVGGGQVVVIHPNSERVNSVVHVGSIGAMVSYRKQTFANEEQIGEDTNSATAQLRDKFAADHNLRAVDAGFDSVIAAINGSRIDSWALIRGITDYQHGQSRASRMWQMGIFQPWDESFSVGGEPQLVFG